MHTIPDVCCAERVYGFMCEWLSVLSREDYAHAANMLFTPPSDRRWKALDIKEAVESFGLRVPRPGENYRVTEPNTAIGGDSRLALGPPCDEEEFVIFVHPTFPMEVQWLRIINPERPYLAGSAKLYYPINGRWSDLSSRFEMCRIHDVVAFDLRYIEIM